MCQIACQSGTNCRSYIFPDMCGCHGNAWRSSSENSIFHNAMLYWSCVPNFMKIQHWMHLPKYTTYIPEQNELNVHRHPPFCAISNQSLNNEIRANTALNIPMEYHRECPSLPMSNTQMRPYMKCWWQIWHIYELPADSIHIINTTL